jgi:hypothetical protein
MYTGLHNGNIVSIRDGEIKVIGFCGRPLGMRIFNESLFVIDANKGDTISYFFIPVSSREGEFHEF